MSLIWIGEIDVSMNDNCIAKFRQGSKAALVEVRGGLARFGGWAQSGG
ncbi:hypothetical protein SNOG_08730 [Parastagonospora nodorum SN15]|uniref:Uncharacterized protein n=1 Tax=Phaeosphaeria nodorum (strain SN15 / ATCC MYA-4574 / FGSC 10173) TaxID=321614 RepID=Q0UHN4_PHANO|nr:hypothetical protein SNOG_08730 [Parastagonospora nodorum SN15]EAT83898.1 hypothetical protein SNOG_08730 [Parastagonospora nodorum SN15]